jgi:signal transduction histidine kinase
VRANASEHIHDPEFHRDMLDAIDHALKRMGKVQSHLSVLKGELEPHLIEIDLCECLNELVKEFSRKLTGMNVVLECSGPLRIQADQEFLGTVLENLLMNSLHAGGEGTAVRIKVVQEASGEATIDVSDDGPGIPEYLLPDRLFEPFCSSKSTGSGIGLWQVRKMISVLGWTITAGNLHPGARFFIFIPHGS